MKTMKTIGCLVILAIGMTMLIFGVSSYAEVNNALNDAQMACVVGAGECRESTYCCEAPEYDEYEDPEEEGLGCSMKESGFCVNVYRHFPCSEESWCRYCFTIMGLTECEDHPDGCTGWYDMGTCGEYMGECYFFWCDSYWCEDHPAVYDSDPTYCEES